jgi:hypothetical protein
MARPTNTPQSKVNIIYAEATGSFIVLLAVAERQGFSKNMVSMRKLSPLAAPWCRVSPPKPQLG